VGYADDSIDESGELEALLKEALSITRMRRPMVEIAVQRKTLAGSHVTPLWAPPLDLATRAEDILGVDISKQRLAYLEADATVEELVRWLEEGKL
jgi:predicted component of type VI protein secretion system